MTLHLPLSLSVMKLFIFVGFAELLYFQQSNFKMLCTDIQPFNLYSLMCMFTTVCSIYAQLCCIGKNDSKVQIKKMPQQSPE